MRWLVIPAVGTLWGAVALAVALAMRHGDVPAPAEAPAALAPVLIAVYLPFVLGIGVEVIGAPGRSPGLIEVAALTIGSGVGLAYVLTGALLLRGRLGR